MYRNRNYFGDVRFTIHGGRLRYKRYDAHFLKKSSVELPLSSFGDHLINILRKVNRLIYTFKINLSNIYNFCQYVSDLILKKTWQRPCRPAWASRNSKLQFPIKRIVIRIVIHIKYRDTYPLWKKCIVIPLLNDM